MVLFPGIASVGTLATIVVISLVLAFVPAFVLYKKNERNQNSEKKYDWRVLWLSISIIIFVVLVILSATGTV